MIDCGKIADSNNGMADIRCSAFVNGIKNLNLKDRSERIAGFLPLRVFIDMSVY